VLDFYDFYNYYFDLTGFSKDGFYEMFKDCGAFSLSMPNDFGTKPLWFNEEPYISKWKHFIIPIDGGTLIHRERQQ